VPDGGPARGRKRRSLKQIQKRTDVKEKTKAEESKQPKTSCGAGIRCAALKERYSIEAGPLIRQKKTDGKVRGTPKILSLVERKSDLGPWKEKDAIPRLAPKIRIL